MFSLRSDKLEFEAGKARGECVIGAVVFVTRSLCSVSLHFFTAFRNTL